MVSDEWPDRVSDGIGAGAAGEMGRKAKRRCRAKARRCTRGGLGFLEKQFGGDVEAGAQALDVGFA